MFVVTPQQRQRLIGERGVGQRKGEDGEQEPFQPRVRMARRQRDLCLIVSQGASSLKTQALDK